MHRMLIKYLQLNHIHTNPPCTNAQKNLVLKCLVAAARLRKSVQKFSDESNSLLQRALKFFSPNGRAPKSKV